MGDGYGPLWQSLGGDHQYGVGHQSDGQCVLRRGELVHGEKLHSEQVYGEVLHDELVHDALVRDVQEHVAMELASAKPLFVLAFVFTEIPLVFPAQALCLTANTKFQDARRMGCHSASRSNALHSATCEMGPRGTLVDWLAARGQALVQQRCDVEQCRGVLVLSGGQKHHGGELHECPVSCGALVYHDELKHRDDLPTHGG